jgi:hypothetical protein
MTHSARKAFAEFMNRFHRLLDISCGVVLCLAIPVTAWGQLSVSPASVMQNQCYTIFTSYPWATLDVLYTLNSAGPYEIIGWPSTNSAGQSIACTNLGTQTGTYRFVGVRLTQSGNYATVSAQVTVTPYVPQPTSLSFSTSSGYAGVNSYVITVGNGANMLVDLDMTVNGVPTSATIATNSAGQWAYTLLHDNTPGEYKVWAIKNHSRQDWVPLNPRPVYQVLPPQPTSLSVTPTTVTAGAGSYVMAAGNSAGITATYMYRFNGGPELSIGTFQFSPVSSGSPNGVYTQVVPVCTPPGTYLFTKLKNYLNAVWLATNATVTVLPPGVPTASASPSGGTRDATTNNVSVTLTGTKLCNVSLSTQWPGLTFSNIQSSVNGNSVTATFAIAPNAGVGLAPVTLTASGGTTTVNFSISNSAGPLITGVSPPSGTQGTAAQVQINGNNLNGATLSSSWAGLTFTNVTSNPQGTQVGATFNISAAAAVGTPTITLTTPAGSTNIQGFSIQAGLLALYWKRDYIHDDRGMTIALATPQSTDTEVPTTPANVSHSTLSSTSVTVTWNGSTDSESGMSGYRIYRQKGNGASLPVGATADTASNFTDPTLEPNTTYTFRVVAVDKAGNPSATSAGHTVTTPPN